MAKRKRKNKRSKQGKKSKKQQPATISPETFDRRLGWVLLVCALMCTFLAPWFANKDGHVDSPTLIGVLLTGVVTRCFFPGFVAAVFNTDNRPNALRGIVILVCWGQLIHYEPIGVWGHILLFIGGRLLLKPLAQPWAYAFIYLYQFAAYGNHYLFVSFMALFSILLILLNGGHIRNLGKFVDEMTEGERAASWVLGPGIIGVHCLHHWWDTLDRHHPGQTWAERWHHFHWPHFEFGEDIAFAIMGVLAAAAIATSALGSLLCLVQQGLLRYRFPFFVRGWLLPERLVKAMMVFKSYSLGACAGEAPAGSVTQNYLDQHLDHEHKDKAVLNSALALSSSAGILPIAAPPVAVIWKQLTAKMGWRIKHLLLFTGIPCLLIKAYCAWRVSGFLEKVERQEIEWLTRREWLLIGQFVLLIVAHVFLTEHFGLWFTLLTYAWDITLCGYVIARRIGHHPGMPLTIFFLIVTFHLVGHEGEYFVEQIADNQWFSFADMPLWLVIFVGGTLSFFISALADNAVTTKTRINISLPILNCLLVGTLLRSDTIAALDPKAQQAVWTATAFIVTVIVQSLTAGVVSVPANPVVNVSIAKHYGIGSAEWISKARWLSGGAYLAGMAWSYFLGFVILPWYLGL